MQLRKLISSRVHQSLIALFSHIDPGGWKIWRNLCLVSSRNSRIREFSYLTNCYFYYDENDLVRIIPDSLNPDGIALPDEVLNEWLRISLRENYGMPQVILWVFEKLKNYSEYQQFIERSRLFHSLKAYQNISYIDTGDKEIIISDGDMRVGERQVLNLICLELKEYLSIELKSRYIQKEKINSELGLQYYNILALYFTDLISDGYVEKLPDYLELSGHVHLVNGEWVSHRGRLEYMIKLGKCWLREKLKTENNLRDSQMRVYK